MEASIRSSAETDPEYAALEQLVVARIDACPVHVYATNADPDALWEMYLSALPEGPVRQHYTCNCCKRFVQSFGHLALIDAHGRTESLLWEETPGVPEFFRRSLANMAGIVRLAKVTGPFLSSEPRWGTPQTGAWTHLCGPNRHVYSNPLLSASQAMAEKRQDFGMLNHALADYSKDAAEQAVRVLGSDALYRSEKAEGVAKWFLGVHQSVAGTKGDTRANKVWQAVAAAPPGFCHVRSTVISTLLDDIKAGLPVESIQRRWAEKLHPLQYQRPTAPPSNGAIEAAEKVVEKVGIANSLKRRYATLDDVQRKLWEPRATETPTPAGGVFAHLRTPDQKACQQVELPPAPITWEKFRREVLPTALSMEVNLPYHGAYYGLVTAEDAEAPPIIQWDGYMGVRNPVSWYFYTGGSDAIRWMLTPKLTPVDAVFLAPPHWIDEAAFPHHKRHVLFAISAAKDSLATGTGLCIFPEMLRAELHGVRAVIEAHSKKGTVSGRDRGNANGIAFDGKSALTVRVETAGGYSNHTIDRFD